MNHDDEICTTFWENVDELMSRRGLNVYSLAEKCGLARRSLERSRQRNSVPDGYNTYQIARVLGTTVENLFEKTTEKTRIMGVLGQIEGLCDSDRELIATLCHYCVQKTPDF